MESNKRLVDPLAFQRRIAILVVVEDLRVRGADDAYLSETADLFMSDLDPVDVDLIKMESDEPRFKKYIDALVSPDSELWPYKKPLLSTE